MKSIFGIYIGIIFLSLNVDNGITPSEFQVANLTKINDCGIQSVTLNTERIEKKRKFLFWPLRHKKIILTDRIIDQNGNEVFKKKSVFISSMDASDTRKFNRIKIVENEIWIFNHGKDFDKDGIIKKYNYCGEFIGTKIWEDGDFYEE